MSESHDTGLRPEALDPARPPVVETPWGALALHLVGGRWVAADAWCPHMLGPLHQGTRTGDEIVCPWHAWRFDLVSGRRTDAPTADEQVAPGRDACRIAVHATRLTSRGTLAIDPPPSAA